MDERIDMSFGPWVDEGGVDRSYNGMLLEMLEQIFPKVIDLREKVANLTDEQFARFMQHAGGVVDGQELVGIHVDYHAMIAEGPEVFPNEDLSR